MPSAKLLIYIAMPLRNYKKLTCEITKVFPRNYKKHLREITHLTLKQRKKAASGRLGNALKLLQKFARFRGLRGGGEDSAVVGFEHFEPMIDIGGVIGTRR